MEQKSEEQEDAYNGPSINVNVGMVFKTLSDVEDAIKYLQDKNHHPLKVY